MKKFGVIFQYELMNYIKNKSYVITTVIIALVAGIIMFVPNFIDIGSVTGENKNDVSDENSGADSDSTILVYDKSGMVTDISFIQNFYPDDAIKKASGENELVDKVKADEVSAGFVVNSLTDYDYYVYNQSMTDVAPTRSLVSCSAEYSYYFEQSVYALLHDKKIEDCIDGKTYGQDAMAGLDKNWVRILDINEAIVPKKTDQIVEDTINELISGKKQVFSGNLTGVDPYDSTKRIDLNTPYIENEISSSPTFSYVLDDVITIVE